MQKLSYEQANKYLKYDPDTGAITRQGYPVNPRRPNGIITNVTARGYEYQIIKQDYKQYKAQKIAWLLMTGEWPTSKVGHKDGNPLNNKWENLEYRLKSSEELNYTNANKLLGYEPDTGVFTCKSHSYDTKIGKRVDFIDYTGKCRKIGALSGTHPAHKVAYLLQNKRWPTHEIMHINGDRTDNRWDNLYEYKSPANGELTQTIVKELFAYTPETGKLTRLIGRDNCVEISNGLNRDGYIVVSIFGKPYRAHRVIWLMMTGSWPEDQIDHIDGNPSNNKWNNLGDATGAENMRLPKRNTSGVIGVSPLEKGKYRAHIMVNGKNIELGVHTTLEEAETARKAAEKKYGFHPNHGRK